MLFYHVKGYYWPIKGVWKKVESQGKVSEKSGNFDMDNEWQPWYIQASVVRPSTFSNDTSEALRPILSIFHI